MKNIRIPIVVVIVSVAAYLTVGLAQSSSSSSLLLSQSYIRIFFASAQTQGRGEGQQNANSAVSNFSLPNLISQGSPYQGSKSAPVTIIDFSDFQCHLCARYVKNTEPKINETYVQNNKVALVFKHLPNRGFDSMPAASRSLNGTNDQGKFWQFHNLLYEKQGPIDSGWANNENLKKLALQIPGLDTTKFNSCFDSQKVQIIC